MEGKRPLFVKNRGQPPAPKSAQSLGVALGKSVGSCCTEREEVLTTRPGDAGAMPRTACVVAAIHSLVNRASAPDGDVRAAREGMTCIYPHQMFQADFLVMFREVQRQEEIAPLHTDDAETGKEIFFFFAESVLPLILSDDWVYEAARRFAAEYADEYFVMLRLLTSVRENQERLAILRQSVRQFIETVIASGYAPNSVNLTKLSDFKKIIDLNSLPVNMKLKANLLYDETLDLEHLYVNVVSQAIQAMYEKALPRMFYVVRRALKVKMELEPSIDDKALQDTSRYLNWCYQHLPEPHVLQKALVKHRNFYRIVRNVDSHKNGPKWRSEANSVYLPDKKEQITVDITEYSKRYRYLMYFCEVGARGILAAFCDRERGAISNGVMHGYIKIYNNPELQTRLCDYII